MFFFVDLIEDFNDLPLFKLLDPDRAEEIDAEGDLHIE